VVDIRYFPARSERSFCLTGLRICRRSDGPHWMARKGREGHGAADRAICTSTSHSRRKTVVAGTQLHLPVLECRCPPKSSDRQ
jgi:hypothetical protein